MYASNNIIGFSDNTAYKCVWTLSAYSNRLYIAGYTHRTSFDIEAVPLTI